MLSAHSPLLAALGQHAVEIGDGACQAIVQRHARFPTKVMPRKRDIGTAL
jgi:hypothetical protein